jgi:hypothetical protein
VGAAGAGEGTSTEGAAPLPLPPPPLRYYVASLDLEKCYDNVDTARLYNLVRRLLAMKDGAAGRPGRRGGPAGGDVDDEVVEDDDEITGSGRGSGTGRGGGHGGGAAQEESEENEEEEEEEFTVHKYAVTHFVPSLERVVSKPVRFVGSRHAHFKDVAERLAQSYKKSILTDGVLYAQITPAEVLRLVKTHLFSHVVNVSFGAARRAAYTQVKGIPQGSILSPLLCNLYYGHAERAVFGAASEVPTPPV